MDADNCISTYFIDLSLSAAELKTLVEKQPNLNFRTISVNYVTGIGVYRIYSGQRYQVQAAIEDIAAFHDWTPEVVAILLGSIQSQYFRKAV